jgi:hypothetical protein
VGLEEAILASCVTTCSLGEPKRAEFFLNAKLCMKIQKLRMHDRVFVFDSSKYSIDSEVLFYFVLGQCFCLGPRSNVYSTVENALCD